MRFTRSAARWSAGKLVSKYAGFSAPCAPAFHIAVQQTNAVAASLNPKLFIVSLASWTSLQFSTKPANCSTAVDPTLSALFKRCQADVPLPNRFIKGLTFPFRLCYASDLASFVNAGIAKPRVALPATSTLRLWLDLQTARNPTAGG